MALLKDQTENYIGVWDEEMTKESDRLKEILCMKIKKEFSRDLNLTFVDVNHILRETEN
jgi:hypothetical protein